MDIRFVDPILQVTTSNDGRGILKYLDFWHPSDQPLRLTVRQVR